MIFVTGFSTENFKNQNELLPLFLLIKSVISYNKDRLGLKLDHLKEDAHVFLLANFQGWLTV